MSSNPEVLLKRHWNILPLQISKFLLLFLFIKYQISKLLVFSSIFFFIKHQLLFSIYYAFLFLKWAKLHLLEFSSAKLICPINYRTGIQRGDDHCFPVRKSREDKPIQRDAPLGSKHVNGVNGKKDDSLLFSPIEQR